MPFPPGMISSHQFPYQYFSGSDLSLYWNDRYLLEVVALAFQLQELVQPIYGWNSYVYVRTVRGARQIQGQFQVALVVPDMVRTVLGRIQRDQETPRGVADQSQVSEELVGGTLADYARLEREAMERLLGRRVLSLPGASERTYYPTLPELDLVIRFGATDDPSVFSSVIDISEADAYRLTGVQILGMQHQIQTNGNPVVEVYSFLARDLVPITSN